MRTSLKTHTCGELRADDVGKEVVLAGWVHRRRDHGGLIFIDLRDRWGITQVVVDPRIAAHAHAVASEVRNEYVLRVHGVVERRPAGTENPRLPTGQIDVVAHAVEILNSSLTPPFYVNEEGPVDEALRLRFRYLDLRRPFMTRNIVTRARIVKFIRDWLDARDFIEVETPILGKSTPEGARDFLVPSRLHPGEFYALPQSPQQYKQLLMVAGVERYFQLARCFRDEDLRADRQPEFTQLDVEMSFVDQEDILRLMEELFTELATAIRPDAAIPRPFPRLTYDDAIARYGVDRPDLRFGMELFDVSDIAATTDFQVFRQAVAAGGQVKGLVIAGAAGFSRKQIDELTETVKRFGAKGLATIALTGDVRTAPATPAAIAEAVRSPIAKFLTPGQVKAIVERANASAGDLLVMVADQPAVVAESLGRLRAELGRTLGLADPHQLAFCWIVDFPAFEWKAEENRWDAVHHPFTMPKDEDLPYLLTDPGRVRAKQYDLICNGWELGGGSIRISDPTVQVQVFQVMGHTAENVEQQFGHLLTAFRYGVPPHGGIAIGIDRLAMILVGAETIRDVIVFPKTQSATDLLMGAPAPVRPEQLQELHIEIKI